VAVVELAVRMWRSPSEGCSSHWVVYPPSNRPTCATPLCSAGGTPATMTQRARDPNEWNQGADMAHSHGHSPGELVVYGAQEQSSCLAPCVISPLLMPSLQTRAAAKICVHLGPSVFRSIRLSHERHSSAHMGQEQLIQDWCDSDCCGSCSVVADDPSCMLFLRYAV
jgi:hypothetical protein